MFESNNGDYFERYQKMQKYVGWEESDSRRIVAAKSIVKSEFPAMVDDFYATIKRTPDASKVLTGGDTQIERLKQSLLVWIDQLFEGKFDETYVSQRYRVGNRHVEIGLDQVYTNTAMSRLRTAINHKIISCWEGDSAELAATVGSINRILDLDLCVIEDAYQTAHTRNQKREERYATIGKISGGIAHEIRNPLNVMKTSIYYLKNAQSITEEKRSKHFSRIESAIDDSNRIITALSEFARLPEPNFSLLSIEKIVRDAVSKNISVDDESQSHLKVTIDCSLDDDAILGESAQLLIAFGNLIRNACHAIDYSGEINVEIGERNGKKIVAIKDSGVGIEKEHLDKILEPLFSTKPKGIGLGLAITKAILNAHQAELVVESQVGVGSEFAVLFPIREKVVS